MTRSPRENYVRLYPEVGRAGSLRAALQVAFDAAGVGLTAILTGAPGWWDCAAQVDNGIRVVQVVLGSQERCFLLGFWERGVQMARGNTTDLDAVAAATGMWQAGARLHELHTGWPFVHYGELAEAYERGNPVEVRWAVYRRGAARHIDHALIEAAYAQPRLRLLFPFTSHSSLFLSRCTRFPFTRDLPTVTPTADGIYTVAWPAGSPYGHGIIDRVGTPHDAAALVVDRLPDACGPAVDATATELHSHDTAT